MTEFRNSVLAGLAFALLFGIFLAIRHDLQYAVIAGPVSGFAVGFIFYLFTKSKAVSQQTQIETKDGEEILHSGGANHFKKGEAVGGKLYLLSNRLQFQSHNFNLQNHGLEIGLGEIKQICFFNSLGLVPNGLEIQTYDGQKEKFVVNNRKFWKELIEKTRV